MKTTTCSTSSMEPERRMAGSAAARTRLLRRKAAVAAPSPADFRKSRRFIDTSLRHLFGGGHSSAMGGAAGNGGPTHLGKPMTQFDEPRRGGEPILLPK